MNMTRNQAKQRGHNIILCSKSFENLETTLTEKFMETLGEEWIWKFLLLVVSKFIIPYTFQKREDQDAESINFASRFVLV